MMLVVAYLLCVVSGYTITFTSVGVGPNITTAFLDVQGRAAKSSPFLNNQMIEEALHDAINADNGYGFPLGECVENTQSGISTCSDGKLFYPYYVKYTTTMDTKNPYRIGHWIAEEYGWATIVQPFGSFDIVISSYVAYYNPNNVSEREVFHSFSNRLCGGNGTKPGSISFIVTGDLFSFCSHGNYTLTDNKWLVNMTYRGQWN